MWGGLFLLSQKAVEKFGVLWSGFPDPSSVLGIPSLKSGKGLEKTLLFSAKILQNASIVYNKSMEENRCTVHPREWGLVYLLPWHVVVGDPCCDWCSHCVSFLGHSLFISLSSRKTPTVFLLLLCSFSGVPVSSALFLLSALGYLRASCMPSILTATGQNLDLRGILSRE